jgi:hypothetical protein
MILTSQGRVFPVICINDSVSVNDTYGQLLTFSECRTYQGRPLGDLLEGSGAAEPPPGKTKG